MTNMSSMQGVEECNTGLCLGVGSHADHQDYMTSKKSPSDPAVQFHMLFPTKEDQVGTKEKTRKRAKKAIEREEAEAEAEAEAEGGGTRKKLKLNKEQSTLLEDSFREHQTLNLTQKQELADRLNLTPRQVEVWYQNKRARNKLKQTEVECGRLVKWCESLSSENRRLKRELQELRMSAEPAAGTMLPICPPTSCDQSTVSD